MFDNDDICGVMEPSLLRAGVPVDGAPSAWMAPDGRCAVFGHSNVEGDYQPPERWCTPQLLINPGLCQVDLPE